MGTFFVIYEIEKKMRPLGLDPKTKDYLYLLKIDTDSYENQLIKFETVFKANMAFKSNLEKFKQLIDCLTADRCFNLWIAETEDLLTQSEEAISQYAQRYITDHDFKEIHDKLAAQIRELASRIYEGHWAYGVSQEADQQFDDLTELCRRIWQRDSKAWITLAKAWNKINVHA